MPPGLTINHDHPLRYESTAFAAIPESDIKQTCERFGMSLDTWQLQKHAFGLLKKVYAKRAKLRGEQHSFNRRDVRGSFLALCERFC